MDVAALKPCVLTLVEGTWPENDVVLYFTGTFSVTNVVFFFPTAEDYDEDAAAVHVRRLLDIVACTTCFGPSAADAGKNAQDKNSGKKSNKAPANAKQSSPPPGPTSSSVGEGEGEMSNSCPTLGSFYEFFSLSHLTPPLQCEYSFALCLISETPNIAFCA